MAYAKNHTQKGRFSIRRERERGSRTRQTHFRLYNSYSMQFAQTRKQKKQKEIPSHRMTGTRGSHFDRKKEAASLQRSTFKCRNRHWRVEGFGVYSAPAYKAIIDGTVESIPLAFYNVLYRKSHFLQGFSQNQAHFVRGYASAATLRPSPAPLSSGSYAIFGGDAVFVRTFCNSIPKSVRISNFLGMRCTKSLNSFAVCPLPFLYGKSTRNVV